MVLNTNTPTEVVQSVGSGDDDGNSPLNGVNTPPETVVTNSNPTFASPNSPIFHGSSVPWPNSTFIIRSASSGEVLTLLDGQVTLAPPGGRGSIHWACVETKGWLGFRNTVSGLYLGHEKYGVLCCVAPRHALWEWFCVRMTPEGGFVLILTNWECLWKVGLVGSQGGVKKMAKVGEGSEAIVWEFVRV